MQVEVDLGNIWEMLTAVGTIAAVVVSLYLARKNSKKRLQISPQIRIVEGESERQAHFIINVVNTGEKPIQIEQIQLSQKGQIAPLTLTSKNFDSGSSDLKTRLNPSERAEYRIALPEFMLITKYAFPSPKGIRVCIYSSTFDTYRSKRIKQLKMYSTINLGNEGE